MIEIRSTDFHACLGHLDYPLAGGRAHVYLPVPQSRETIMLTRSLFRVPAGAFWVWTCGDAKALDACLADRDSFYPAEPYRRHLKRLRLDTEEFADEFQRVLATVGGRNTKR